jgi:hypothetical protein
MASSDRIKEAMETLLKIFQEDNLEKVARAVFRGGDIPADKWSFLAMAAGRQVCKEGFEGLLHHRAGDKKNQRGEKP